MKSAIAHRWPGPLRLWGGTAALALVVMFWVAVFFANRAGRPVSHPLLDVVFLAYFVLSPTLGFVTLLLLRKAGQIGIERWNRAPIQAWLAFAAVAAWVVGLAFLDLQ
jgi:hypothetical protein